MSKKIATTQRQFVLTDNNRCGPTGCWERAAAPTLVTTTGEGQGQQMNAHQTYFFVAMAPPDKLGKTMDVKPRGGVGQVISPARVSEVKESCNNTTAACVDRR